jgi:hypothetical protein
MAAADMLLDRVWSNTEISPNIGKIWNIRGIRTFKILAALAARGVAGEDVGAATQTRLKRRISLLRARRLSRTLIIGCAVANSNLYEAGY